jgi:regulator of replication initiation timing
VKIKALNEKINVLQTNLENTKTDLAYLHKVKKSLINEKEVLETELEMLKKKFN